MSIKVGDYVTLKDDISDAVRRENIAVPIKVESISECAYQGKDAPCTECPGYINGVTCFGRNCGFIVRLVDRDWDE